MPARFDTISFLSDYGARDEFVGVVKSVIRSIAPEVTVVDITHEVPAYDVRAGSLTLVRSVQYLCPGVVLAIVDPGVGTTRRAVAVEVGDGESYLIGPDNGVLAPAVGMVGGATRAVELDNPEYQLPAPGATFAGRDVFAPAAAHLCAGVAFEDLGHLIDPATMVPGMMPLPRDEDGTLVGQVLWVDRYGNCQLNIDPDQIDGWGDRIQLRWGAAGTAGTSTEGTPRVRTARRTTAFDDLSSGDVGLVVDSYGLLAVALSRSSAADMLDLAANDEVVLAPLGDGPDEPDPGADDRASGVTVPVTLGGRPR
jgi:S-adenosyl-L-methionine hydrolase (adenosine-forming)